MSTSTLQLVTSVSGELPEMPIEPAWILEGTPQARGTVLVQSVDKLVSSGMWSCTAGRFLWEFTWDEFVHILEGEAIITEDGGTTHHLQSGDIAHFPIGLKTQWQVPAFVKKVFTIRTPEPFVL